MRLEHDHSPEAIDRRLSAGPRASYVRDWVYGGIDGAVTTFAIVAGVVGADLSSGVALILGVANLVADGFSMAASNDSGTKAEHDDAERLRRIEERHIAIAPEGEREEIRQIYAAKGFTGEDLERVVAVITSDRKRWVETMLAEEYGLALAGRSPLGAAASTFSAFLLCGSVPLLSFVAGSERAFAWSIGLTAAVFFAIGAAKSRWSPAPWWRSGLETLAIGAGAAGFAYAIGYALSGLAVG